MVPSVLQRGFAAGPALHTARQPGRDHAPWGGLAQVLRVNATVTKAIRLTVSTDTECTIAAGAAPPDYTMNFGTVDALGITAATCGTKYNPITPGSTAAVYSSTYKLKPTFASQATSNNTITAYVSTDFTSASGLLSVVQASAAPSLASDFSAMSKVSGTPTTVASNVTNNTEVSRYIGVAVAPINGAGTLTGAQKATVTYTLTVQ